MIVNEIHQSADPAHAGSAESGADEARATRTSSLLRCQRLFEISDQVVLVLDADRQPHHVGARA
jgi:hypothetical protein